MKYVLIILLQINKVLDDTIKLLDDVPRFVYVVLVLVIILLLIVKPFIDYYHKVQTVKNLDKPESNSTPVDKKVFVKINRKYLAKNKIEKVIKNMQSFSERNNDEQLKKEITHLSSRFYNEKGILNSGQKELSNTIEINKIKFTLIEILESIIEGDD